MNRHISGIAVALIGALFVAAPGVANAKATTVFEDAAGDTEVDANPTPGLDQGGFDLISGSIELKGGALEFTVAQSAMPPFGTMPESFRFLWAFAVDGTNYRITAKTADVGKPDAASGTGTDRVGQVDTAGHFRLEGECESSPTPALNFINCQQLGDLEGSFDPAAKTFTVTVPLKLVSAKAGSSITQGGGNEAAICTICWVSHLAERSHSATIIDTAVMTKTYKVPKK